MLYGATNNPLRPVINEIKTIAALGFDYLELCLDPPEGLPGNLRAQKEEIRSVLDGQGLTLLVGHLPVGVWLADAYASIREASVGEVRLALETCAELGIKKAVIHPGYLTGLIRLTPHIGKGLAEETMGQVLEAARRLGVTLCLENLFPWAGHMYRPEEFPEILEKFPDLMMTLDLGHANIKAPADRARRFVEMAGGRIRHVHAGDNSGRDDEHLPVGAGRADMAGGLAALKELGYDETITIEVFAPDRDYLASSLAKVKAMWDRA